MLLFGTFNFVAFFLDLSVTPERLPIFFFFSPAAEFELPKRSSLSTLSRKSNDGFVAVDVFVGMGGGGLLLFEGDVDAVVSLLPSPERSGNEEDENEREGFETVEVGFETGFAR